MNKLPQDLANLLAVAVRDVIWYRDKVEAFLDGCGVPTVIMIEVGKMKRDKVPTVKVVQRVLEDLAANDEGWETTRRILTDMYYWKDVHTIEPERKDKAVRSLKEFQKAFQKYKAQKEFQDEQRQREKEMHQARIERAQMQPLDHEKLQAFRDEFDRVHSINDPNERGNRFQDLLNLYSATIASNQEEISAAEGNK